MENRVRLPGLCDVHVHFREPGFEYKETIKSGSMAAARGGVTAVCTMPNLKPVPDCREALQMQLDAIARDAQIRVYPLSAITCGEKGEKLAAMEELGGAIAFSDDGHGVQSEDMMREAMKRAKALGKIIVAHCEDERYETQGERETAEVVRNIRLAKETGCKLHICHVSKKESIKAIRKGKAEGVDVTCETAPHYLIMTEDEVRAKIAADPQGEACGGRFKMNPPIGNDEDRKALIEALKDGTIDMIITDHAPHSAEEKARGFTGSLSGVVGLETSFPLMYTYFVKTNIIPMEKLISLMAENPRKRFGLPLCEDDYSEWDLSEEYEIKPEEFLSMGRATPFEGVKVFGRCLKTVCGGNTVYEWR